MKAEIPSSVHIHFSLRVSFEELQQQLSKDQLQAFMRGMAEVIAASRRPVRKEP